MEINKTPFRLIMEINKAPFQLIMEINGFDFETKSISAAAGATLPTK